MGSLAILTMRLKIYGGDAEPSWWTPFDTATVPLEAVDPLARQIEHFGAVIRGDTTPLVSAREGLRNLRVTQAVAKAASTGQRVEVPVH